MKGKNGDLSFLLYLLPLVAMGLINLWSASLGGMPWILWRQGLWLAIGSVLGLWLSLMDYRQWEAFTWPIYMAGIVLLVLLWPLGVEIGGARRWIGIGGIYLQPSEFAKLSLVVALARYFSQLKARDGLEFRDLVPAALLAALPAFLVALQPDLGTALVFLGILGLMVLYWGVRRRTLLGLLAVGGVLGVGGWFLLRDYQRQRILAFLDPNRDPLGTGYHLIQSKIAIGSGGVLGKGIGHGTQCKLGFLPEYHTDFAFSLLGEEWGFLGSAVALLLFLGLLHWGLDTARKAKDPFGASMAVGVTAMLFLHVSVNTAMAMGLLPVVGLPLPFFSYGGSCTVATLMGIGILLSIRRQRYVFNP